MLRLFVERLMNIRCSCEQDAAAYRTVLDPNHYSKAPALHGGRYEPHYGRSPTKKKARTGSAVLAVPGPPPPSPPSHAPAHEGTATATA